WRSPLPLRAILNQLPRCQPYGQLLFSALNAEDVRSHRLEHLLDAEHRQPRGWRLVNGRNHIVYPNAGLGCRRIFEDVDHAEGAEVGGEGAKRQAAAGAIEWCAEKRRWFEDDALAAVVEKEFEAHGDLRADVAGELRIGERPCGVLREHRDG